jgi:acetyl-CoA carboxylase carboxyl transferase subunit alpha
VDEIVPEPAGGAHVDHDALFKTLDIVLERQLRELTAVPLESLPDSRYEKFRSMGRLGREFSEQQA